jgi:hypothetical protein
MFKVLSLTLLLLANVQTVDIGKSLQKKWNLCAVEDFGVKAAPKDSLASDYMDLKADGTFLMRHFGHNKSGTYKYNAAAKTINFTSGTEKMFFKFFELKGNELLVEYQQPSLVRTKLYYTLSED